jgi:hypothetical protein
MSGLDLPQIAPNARASCDDAATCAEWLASLPRLNAATTHAALAARLEELNGAHVAAAERLAILELLRGPIADVQIEQAKKFAGKPLPHSPQRREILASVTALWDALGLGYQRALQALAAMNGDRASIALACHRAIDATARTMLAHAHAYVQPRPTDLARLHRLYAFAEQRGIAVQPVPDRLSRTGRSCTVTRTYAQALLLDASSPRERRPEHVELVDRWLGHWAPKIAVSPSAPRGSSTTPMLVDLATESGASRRERTGPTVRFLDVSEISRSLAKRVHAIKQGKTPAEVGLEGDVEPQEALALLVALYRHWCEDQPRRAHERRNVNAPVCVCTGITATHFALGDRLADANAAGGAALPPASSETWVLRDESIAGVGLIRRRDDSRAAPLGHGQLLMVRPEAGGAGMLAAVQWLQEAPDGDLHVGARILPGIAQPVTARAAEPQESETQAIALSALAALAAPPTIVLPRGWFAPGRVLNIPEIPASRVRLTSLLEHGSDFERASFDPA